MVFEIYWDQQIGSDTGEYCIIKNLTNFTLHKILVSVFKSKRNGMNKAWENREIEVLHTNYFLVQKFIKKKDTERSRSRWDKDIGWIVKTYDIRMWIGYMWLGIKQKAELFWKQKVSIVFYNRRPTPSLVERLWTSKGALS